MKCPICGNERFIKPSLERILSNGEQKLFLDCYVCTKCGHVEIDGMPLVQKYNEIKSRIEELEKENQKLQKEIDAVDSQKFDPSVYEKKIREYEKQKQNTEDYAEIELADDMIAYYKKIIESGVNPKDTKYGDNVVKLMKNTQTINCLKIELMVLDQK